jgi:hypothetical protein
LSTFDIEKFGIINRIPASSAVVSKNQEFYQMGEEGNPPDAYELQDAPKMKRLIFRDFVVTNKYPNNIVLLDSIPFVCAVNDLAYDPHSDSFNVTVVPFRKQGNFFTGFPCDSSDCDIYSVSGGLDYSKKRVVKSSNICNQFVCLINDREMAKQQHKQQTSALGPSAIDKAVHWVCIPLMHSRF